jgi:hypothetical protein
VIISGRNFKDFIIKFSSHMVKWFAVNKFFLSLDKTNTVKFITKNSSHSTLHIGYKEKYIKETGNTKFLGLQIYNYLNLKNHIKQMIL